MRIKKCYKCAKCVLFNVDFISAALVFDSFGVEAGGWFGGKR